MRARVVTSRPGWRRSPGIGLVALLACRDEMAYLPGYFRNVAPHVDGIVALDDGSTDGSADYLAARPEVVELLRVPPDRPAWDETGNHRALVAAALRAGATWAIVLDADERVEHRFRERAERVIARGGRLGKTAYAVRLRELWSGPDRYRCDGIWNGKAPARLFPLSPGQRFAPDGLHRSKAPLGSRVARADLEVYHLRMIRPDDRRARRERYERLDPEARWQPDVGYAYLTDEHGLRLRRVRRRRRYVG